MVVRPPRQIRPSTIATLVLAVAVPTALFAQEGGGDVSRTPDGRILHRRSPEPGETAVADTPVFVYEPGGSDREAPTDLVRDGVNIPRPSASTRPNAGELIHTADGLARPPGAAPPSSPGAPSPAAEAARDPSALLPPSPSTILPDDTATDPPSGEPDRDPGGDPGGEPARDEAPPAGDPGDPAAPPDVPATSDGGADPASDPALGPGGEPTEPDPREGLGSEAHPDRDTGREGTLHYNEVFDPSVVPFKRNRALDAVGADYVLRVSSARMERLEPTGNRLERGREVFWGSLLLDGEAGRRVPIPSVSPESQILSYQANPAQTVVFERDAAGNYYATPELDGRLRLVFVTDAPAHWFGRALPRDARAEDVPRALRPKLPRPIHAEALAVARQIGVTPEMGYVPALEALVAWFRAFSPGEPPPERGSVYRDIALGKTGICRHRGHAFVITAQALGIPARYVFNEAHVFVEVYLPGDEPGWLRIDLGGGADELRVHGAEGKRLHQPLMTDPFAQPPEFADAEAAGATRVEGLPAEETPAAPGSAPIADDAAPTIEAPIARARPAPHLQPTKTTIAVSETLVFRGDGVRVSGRVTTARGAPIANGAVQVLLARAADREAVALLGTAAISDGRFAVEVAIPPRQSPGSYEIIAEFLGDGVHAPSVGE